MRARNIYGDSIRQREHAKLFDELQQLVFMNGGRRQVLERIEDHPGKAISDSVLKIIAKMDILDADFRDLKASVERFWDSAFASGTKHTTYCYLQREVWRASFHIAASTQSVSETIKSTMRKYSRRRNAPGGKIYEYWANGFDTKWASLQDLPIYRFNYLLRGSLYHAQLSNADWVGYRCFVTQTRKERFLLSREMLIKLAKRDPEAIRYIKAHSITVRGHRPKNDDETAGLDLVGHYQRYRAVLRKLSKWTICELEDPEFGKQAGVACHALEEYRDLECASLGVSRRWKRCRHCGSWFDMKEPSS